jgi:hypothetical protein
LKIFSNSNVFRGAGGKVYTIPQVNSFQSKIQIQPQVKLNEELNEKLTIDYYDDGEEGNEEESSFNDQQQQHVIITVVINIVVVVVNNKLYPHHQFQIKIQHLMKNLNFYLLGIQKRMMLLKKKKKKLLIKLKGKKLNVQKNWVICWRF